MDLIGSNKHTDNPDIRYIRFISNEPATLNAAGRELDSVDLHSLETSQLPDEIYLNSIICNAFENKLLDSLYGILAEKIDCRQIIEKILKQNIDENIKFHGAVLIGNNTLAAECAKENLNSTHDYTFEINAECLPRPLCALQVAAMMGYEDLIETTLENGSLQTQAVDHGDTAERNRPVNISPLVLAARFGHEKFIEKLLNNKKVLWNRVPINAYQQNALGLTALHFAAIYNHGSVIDVLLNTEAIKGVDLSTGGSVKYPIAFAAALDNLNVLDHLIDAAACRPSKVMAVHAAAAMGKTEALKKLLKNDNFLAKELDANGNSPLVVALAAKKIEVAKLLVAKLTVESNADEVDGILSSEPLISPEYMKAVNAAPDFGEVYAASSNAIQETDFNTSEYELLVQFMNNQSALSEVECSHELLLKLLHQAVEHDNPQGADVILKALLKTPQAVEHGNPKGADVILKALPKIPFDLDGNYFIHIAAMRNRQAVLKNFVYRYNALTTQPNKANELPLHLAIRNDHAEAVECLLNYSPNKAVKMMLQMKSSSRTALHMAVYYHNRSNVKIIGVVVEAMKKHSVSLDQVDSQNLTPLHYAVKYCRQKDLNPCRCIEQLSSLSPVKRQRGGISSALHMAAELGDNGVLDLILRTFYTDQNINDTAFNNINDLDSTNRTALMICAENGDTKGVELLLTYAAKVGKVSGNENEVPLLHRLVRLSVEKPNEIKSALQVFETIKKAVSLNRQSTNNDEKMTDLLTNEIVKHGEFVGEGAGLNVLQLAAAAGASEMLGEFLKITNIGEYDKVTGKLLWKPHHVIPVELYTETSESSSNFKPTEKPKSCIELVVMNCETDKFRKMLDVEPLCSLIEQITYGRLVVSTLLVILHVIFMACLSVYAIQTCYEFQSEQPGHVPYEFCLFLIYPILKFILIISEVSTYFKPSDLKDAGLLKFDDRKCTYMTKYFLFELLSYVTSIVFCILIIVWYAQCILIAQYRDSILFTTYARTVSVVLVFGWLYTIELLRGIPTLQGFAKYLKLIFVKDVVRIVCVYGVVLTGFALAIHVCILVESTSAESVTDSFFETFGQMFGQSGTFGAGADNRMFDRLSASQQSGFVRGLMAIYMLMSAIILINVLIAMINQSYTSVYDESQFLMNYETSKMFVDLTCKTSRTSLVWRWIFRRLIFCSLNQIFVEPPRDKVQDTVA